MTGRVLRLALAAGLTLLVAGPLVSGVSPDAGPPIESPALTTLPAATVTASAVQLALTGIEPGALTAGRDLVITGVVRNGTGKKLARPRVSVITHAGRLVVRSAVQDWTNGITSDAADVHVAGTAKVRKLAPGASGGFSLRIAPVDLGLLSWSSSGPRGITVRVTTGRHVLTSRRTTFVWWPSSIGTATRLSLVTPITAATPSTDAGAPTTAAEAELQPGGRLDRLVEATKDPGFTWAVDPAVLAEAAALRDGKQVLPAATPTGTTGTPTGASTGASSPAGSASPSPAAQEDAAMKAGRQWLTKVGGELPNRALVGLPYADPDLGSVLNNKAGGLLRMTEDLGRRVTKDTLNRTLDTSIAWPGDGRFATRWVSALDRNRITDVLLASSSQPVEDADGATATGRSQLTGGGRTIGGLLYDEDLSTLVSSSGGANSVLSTQTLLSELAAITLESPPTVPTHVLAVTPRAWSPEPGKVQALTAALRSAPFAQLESLTDLRNQAPVTGRADPVYRAAARAGELPPGPISRALALKRRVDVFGPAVTNPDAVLDPYRERIASLLSVAWRHDRNDLSTAGLDVSEQVGELVDGVHLLTGADNKLFTARAAAIQVAIANDTAYDLRLRVLLKPSSGQLSVQAKEIVAKAHTHPTVLLKTKAIASGNVVVSATLQNPDGGVLDEPHPFKVRVRPDWETRGLIGAGSVLGLLLVIGLLRGVRRNRNRVPPTPAPDVDDLAVQLAESKGKPPPPTVVARVEVGAPAGRFGEDR